MERRKFSLIMIFLIFGEFSLFSFEYKSSDGIFRWTLDTTMGIQSFNLLNQENGANAEDSFVLETSGLNFHSFYKNRLLSRTTLDLCFSKRPDFLWIDSPDFMHDDSKLNENLKCVEFEYQMYLPQIGILFMNFLPFGGFSFVNIADERFYGEENFSYYSFSAGIQYYQKLNRIFSHTYYFSYSPMMLIENMKYEHTIHYVNYGMELIVDTSIVSFTLFAIFRNIYEELEQVLLLGKQDYAINTAEIGFSFKVNLF